MEWTEHELARRRVAAHAAIRRYGLRAGRQGMITGALSFVPGLGILMGLLTWRLVEIPSVRRYEERLCRELVEIYLPEDDADAKESIAGLLAARRNPRPLGAVGQVMNRVVAGVMGGMRHLESTMLRKGVELAGKILLPFGAGALVGFGLDYYEMRRLGLWGAYNLEIMAGVPGDRTEPYADFSGWLGCGCAVVALGGLAGLAFGVVMLMNWIRSLSLPLIG